MLRSPSQTVPLGFLSTALPSNNVKLCIIGQCRRIKTIVKVSGAVLADTKPINLRSGSVLSSSEATTSIPVHAKHKKRVLVYWDLDNKRPSVSTACVVANLRDALAVHGTVEGIVGVGNLQTLNGNTRPQLKDGADVRPPLTLEESLQRVGVEVQLVETTPDAADHRIRDEMHLLLKNIDTLRKVRGGRRSFGGPGPGDLPIRMAGRVLGGQQDQAEDLCLCLITDDKRLASNLLDFKQQSHCRTMLVCDGRFDPNEFADFSTQWQAVDRPCADAVLLLDLQAREKHLEESKILAEKQLKAEQHRLRLLQAKTEKQEKQIENLQKLEAQRSAAAGRNLTRAQEHEKRLMAEARLKIRDLEETEARQTRALNQKFAKLEAQKANLLAAVENEVRIKRKRMEVARVREMELRDKNVAKLEGDFRKDEERVRSMAQPKVKSLEALQARGKLTLQAVVEALSKKKQHEERKLRELEQKHGVGE